MVSSTSNRSARRTSSKAAIAAIVTAQPDKVATDNVQYLTDVASAAALLVANERATRDEAQRIANEAHKAELDKAELERKAELAKPLAQKSGALCFAYFQSAARDTLIPTCAALLVACDGNAQRAAALLGDNSLLLAKLHIVTELMTVMSKNAPREFFGDEFANVDSIKIGDLHAHTFGLAKLYRASNKAALKAARDNARKLIEKA